MERELAKIGRRIARQVVEGVRGPFKIDLETLPDYLGPAKLHEEDESDGEDLPGILAARRSGKKTVILPRRNERDLNALAPEIRDHLEFVFIDRFDEALAVALHEPSMSSVKQL